MAFSAFLAHTSGYFSGSPAQGPRHPSPSVVCAWQQDGIWARDQPPLPVDDWPPAKPTHFALSSILYLSSSISIQFSSPTPIQFSSQLSRLFAVTISHLSSLESLGVAVGLRALPVAGDRDLPTSQSFPKVLSPHPPSSSSFS